MNVGDLYLELSGLKSPAGKNNDFAALATTVHDDKLVLPCWVVKNTHTNEGAMLVWYQYDDSSGGPRVKQQVRAFFSIDGQQTELCFPSLATAHRCLNSKNHANFSQYRVYIRERNGSITSRFYSDFSKSDFKGYYNTAQPFSNTFYTTLDKRLGCNYQRRHTNVEEKQNPDALQSSSSGAGDLDATITPKPKRRYTKRNNSKPPPIVIQISEQYNELFDNENSSAALIPAKRKPGRPRKNPLPQAAVILTDGIPSPFSSPLEQIQEVAAHMISDEIQINSLHEESVPLTLEQIKEVTAQILSEEIQSQYVMPQYHQQNSQTEAGEFQPHKYDQEVVDFASYDLFSCSTNKDAQPQEVKHEDSPLQVAANPEPSSLVNSTIPEGDAEELGNNVTGAQMPKADAEELGTSAELDIASQEAKQEEKVIIPYSNMGSDDHPKTPNLDDDDRHDENIVIHQPNPKTPNLNEDDNGDIQPSNPAISQDEEERPILKRKSSRISKQSSKRAKPASKKAGKPKATQTKETRGRKKTN